MLLLGPMAMFAHYLGFKTLAFLLALIAIIFGGHWMLVTPFPISLAGGLSATLGLMTINKY